MLENDEFRTLSYPKIYPYLYTRQSGKYIEEAISRGTKQLSEITNAWVEKYNYHCLTLNFLAHVEVELMDLISSILKRKSNGKPIIIEWGII